ncbi:hypothetical protein CNMCM8980_001155 [Aspergillus fumigatiaffinis]|nr:hypothetical protein CNMCM6457_000297 [Aspergillus fumigatiaffinis]KAF4240506.1 hypothetical protein CNMCM8980_001155 [Aspergillus fumigatiaffinis]
MGSIRVECNDILIIGAGLSGVCSLYNLRKRFPDWSIKVLEAADSVGGTWYWNRYPGARVDSESLSYAFSDKELFQNRTLLRAEGESLSLRARSKFPRSVSN